MKLLSLRKLKNQPKLHYICNNIENNKEKTAILGIQMNSTKFKIAEHVFEIESQEIDIVKLLPNLEPFLTDDKQEPLFSIKIDNSINPSWRGSRIGFFPCPSASFEVYRQDSGAYQILILLDGKIPCAFIESDSEYKNFTLATRGSTANTIFGIDNALMVIFTICSAKHDTLLMHSSVVENEGKAYMFLGVSGRGKSTHSDLWVKHIPGSTLINDDNPVLRIAADGTPIVYGSPWSGKRPIYKNVHYPIGGFASIEQDKENRIHKESIPVAFGILLNSCSTLKFDKKIHMSICGTASKVLERIPVYTLSCRPDKEAAEVSSNVLKA